LKKINRRVLFVLTACVMAAALGGCAFIGKSKPAANDQENTGFKKYESSSQGFEMKYPSEWEIEEDPSVSVAVMLFSGLEGEDDTFVENANVVVQDLAGTGITLDDYTSLNLEQLDTVITGYEEVSQGPATLSGNDAHRLVYTGIQGKLNLKFMQVWTIKDEKAYIFTYVASEDKYDKYLSDVEKMVESFKIK
jgi:hypothetical protein